MESWKVVWKPPPSPSHVEYTQLKERKSKEQGGKQFRVNEKHRVITWEKYWDPKCITFNEKIKALKC